MRLFISIIFYLTGFCSLFIENTTRIDFGLIYFFWILYFLKSNIFDGLKGQKLIFFITLILLYFLPSLGILHFYKLDVTYIVFLAVVFTELLNKFSDDYKYSNLHKNNNYIQKSYIIYFTLMSWTVIGPFLLPQHNTFIGMLSHMFPSAITLLFLEYILKNSKSLINAIIILIFNFIIIGIYLFHHWYGMGRIYLGFYLLAPIIIFFSIFNFSIKKYLIIIIAPLALFFLQYSRYGTSINLETLAIGSAGYHMYITDLIFNNEYLIGRDIIEAYIDELKLFLFIWFPRELWVTKPIGISMWSVDLMFDRSSFINGYIYSHSVGFIGEQKLLLNNFYILGLISILIMIIFLRKLIVKLSFGSNVPAIIFDLNLMSYFWGGMALFGSRVWFLLIPAILFCIISNFFLMIIKNKHQSKRKINS